MIRESAGCDGGDLSTDVRMGIPRLDLTPENRPERSADPGKLQLATPVICRQVQHKSPIATPNPDSLKKPAKKAPSASLCRNVQNSSLMRRLLDIICIIRRNRYLELWATVLDDLRFTKSTSTCQLKVQHSLFARLVGTFT
jgi:hypothetical protein